MIYSTELPVPDLRNQDHTLPYSTQLLEFLLTLRAKDSIEFLGLSVADASELKIYISEISLLHKWPFEQVRT
jgi:hypothetical protein